MYEVILDACVWVDILVGKRPRHEKACRLYRELRERQYVIKGPMTLYFEIISALRHEREKPCVEGTPMYKSDVRGIDEIEFLALPIDEKFVEKYASLDLPRIRGDSIYLAMAKVDQLDFITEDARNLKVATEFGVRAFKIDEFFIRWQV